MRAARSVIALALAGVVGDALMACRARDAAPAVKERGTGVTETPGGPRMGTLIRFAVSPDSEAAAALTDSLSREGWEARAVPRPRDTGEWIVNVVVPGDTSLAVVVAHALSRDTVRPDSARPAVLGAAPSRTPLGIRIAAVNRGTHGMSARVRWAFGPDRRALLVVEDPRGAENDPVPNAFLFAVEGQVVVRRDSVWDVAPSADWRRLAYSRAYTTRPGESDSVPPSEWHRLAGQVGLLESIVRNNAFPTSGMAVAFGAARPHVVGLTGIDSAEARDTALAVAEGWRIGWTLDGTRLALGAPPEITSDDAPAPRWRLVDPESGAQRGAAERSALYRIRWTEGPTLDLSTTVDMSQRRAFRVGNVDVESEDGWIRLYTRDGGRLATPRIVGPGIALTATATGEFIVAIAPDPRARSFESPNHLVVYHILRQ